MKTRIARDSPGARVIVPSCSKRISADDGAGGAAVVGGVVQVARHASEHPAGPRTAATNPSVVQEKRIFVNPERSAERRINRQIDRARRTSLRPWRAAAWTNPIVPSKG